MKSFFVERIIFGTVLIVIGIVSIIMVFNPNGLLVAFDDRPLFVAVLFVMAFTIGLGAWLLSGYRLSMFLEPTLVIACWTFVVVLPILLLPLSIDATGVILGLSLILLVFAYGTYSKWKEGRKRNMTQ